MTKYQMKMARASQQNFDTLLHFFQMLEEKVRVEHPCDLGEWVEKEFEKVSPCWQRVLWGFDILVKNAADPTLSYLDWKPEIKAAMEAYQWISISERLPEPGQEALWVYETGEMTLYARDEDDDMSSHSPAITHWKSLSPPVSISTDPPPEPP